MKLPKALLGAILVGITMQTTGCTKGDAPTPDGENGGKSKKETTKTPANCPGCGMG